MDYTFTVKLLVLVTSLASKDVIIMAPQRLKAW